MYKEHVKPVGKTIFFVVGIVAAALILMWLLNCAVVMFNLPYRSLLQIGILMLMAVGVYILLRNVLCDYVYSVDDDELTAVSSLGGNERMVVRVSLAQIKRVVFHTHEAVKNTAADGSYNMRKSFSKERAYVCIFEENGKIYKMSFEPSEKLLEMLKKHGVEIG